MSEASHATYSHYTLFHHYNDGSLSPANMTMKVALSDIAKMHSCTLLQ